MNRLTPNRIVRAGAVLLLGALVLPATGAEWLPDHELVPGVVPAYTLSNSGRSADMDPAGNIHVVFQSHLDTDVFQVDHTYRTPGGDWAEPVLISGSANARNASLATDGEGGLHVVWENVSSSQGLVEYRFRSGQGVWGDITPLSDGTGLVEDPVIRVDAFERVHVAWVDGRSGNREIMYSRRDDGGWGENRLLSPGGAAPSEPSMATDGLGVVHVVWRDRIGLDRPTGFFNFELMYLRLGPEEHPAIQPERLTHDLSVSRSPFVEATQDGTVHVVWADNRTQAGSTEFEVYYRRYVHGVGWTREKRFTYDGSDHGQPVIVAGAENTLNVAWEDYRHGNPEIYYRQITVEFGWDPRATRLTHDNSPSVLPSLVTGPDGLLIALWTDASQDQTPRVFAKAGDIKFGTP